MKKFLVSLILTLLSSQSISLYADEPQPMPATEWEMKHHKLIGAIDVLQDVINKLTQYKVSADKTKRDRVLHTAIISSLETFIGQNSAALAQLVAETSDDRLDDVTEALALIQANHATSIDEFARFKERFLSLLTLITPEQRSDDGLLANIEEMQTLIKSELNELDVQLIGKNRNQTRLESAKIVEPSQTKVGNLQTQLTHIKNSPPIHAEVETPVTADETNHNACSDRKKLVVYAVVSGVAGLLAGYFIGKRRAK